MALGKGGWLTQIERIGRVFLLAMTMCVLMVMSGCKSDADARASVHLAQVVQSMTQGASIGSKLIYVNTYSEREPNPNAEVGSFLYERYCASCHSHGSKAPGIDGVYSTSPESESDFYIIRYGLNDMRGFNTRLTEFQIYDVLAYLKKRYDDTHSESRD